TQRSADSQRSDQTQNKRENSTATQTDAPKEMQKEETWKGTLVDLDCSGGAAETDKSGKSPTSGDRNAAGAGKEGKDRKPSKQEPQDATTASAGMPSQNRCPATSATTRFGLQLDNGKLLRFDEVGNLRAAEGMKTNKRWMQASSNKANIQAKV